MVDEATEGEGLGAESGDCGGVVRQLVPVGGCSGCNESKSETLNQDPLITTPLITQDTQK